MSPRFNLTCRDYAVRRSLLSTSEIHDDIKPDSAFLRSGALLSAGESAPRVTSASTTDSFSAGLDAAQRMRRPLAAQPKTSWEDLPLEIQSKIVDQLSPWDVARMAGTSKHMNELSKSYEGWATLLGTKDSEDPRKDVSEMLARACHFATQAGQLRRTHTGTELLFGISCYPQITTVLKAVPPVTTIASAVAAAKASDSARWMAWSAIDPALERYILQTMLVPGPARRR